VDLPELAYERIIPQQNPFSSEAARIVEELLARTEISEDNSEGEEASTKERRGASSSNKVRSEEGVELYS